jgi:serine-type D-Ala-D-Ala carboxypeptidase/endopeptidase (penicillin-binding protein 4)
MRRALLELVVAAIAAMIAIPTIADAAPARARKAKAKATAPAKREATTKAKLRPDKGHVRADRSPMRATVSTGERRANAARRSDTAALPLEEQAAQRIEEVLRTLLRDGTTSIYVADASTGKQVFSVYPDDPLNPASNVKLIATAAALDILGPDHRYVTRVLGEIPDDAGVAGGDLYLLGSYDPTLSRGAIDAMAKQLIDTGLRRVTGGVVVGDTPTRDGIYRAFVTLRIAAGAAGEAPVVTIEPASDFVAVEVTATTSAKKKPRRGITVTSSYVDLDDGTKRLKVVVGGEIGVAKTVSRDVWMKERAHFAAHLLRQALRDGGVEVDGDVQVLELRDYVDRSTSRGFLPVPLAEHRSQRLAEIVARVNKRSTNWLADRVIMTAAARKYGGKPSMKAAIDAMYAWLDRRTGMGRDDLVIDNGSGLSYKTELSARQIVTVLRTALGYEGGRSERDETIQQAYRESLAVGGIDGTIRRRFRQVDGQVLGKTGTLQRVISLSGLLEVTPERRLVFSIITNGHRPHFKGRVRNGHEKLIAVLCDYLRKRPGAGGTHAAGPAPDAEEPEMVAFDDLEDEPDGSDEDGVTERSDGP